MGITAGIVSGVAAVGSAVYNNQQQKKAAKAAQQAQQTALQTKPSQNDLDAIANVNAARQQQVQKKRAQSTGQRSTILTGPAGVQTPPPPRNTLLGQ